MRLKTALLVTAALAAAVPARAYNEPPMNLGLTSFMDGVAPPPGMYLVDYVQFTGGNRATDASGHTLPGGAKVDVLANLYQFYYQTSVDVLGGKLALDLVVPVVAPTVSGSIGPFPLTANTAGVGDLVLGPAVQWNAKTFLGKPYFQRVELDVTVPTGEYDKDDSVNPGSNITTGEIYYSMTWMFAPAWEASGRVFYTVNGENPSTQVRAGEAIHGNFETSYALGSNWRAGAAGYFLKQITPDQTAGTATADSEERAIALGPGVFYGGKGATLMLSAPFEFAVENRLQGFRATLELVLPF